MTAWVFGAVGVLLISGCSVHVSHAGLQDEGAYTGHCFTPTDENPWTRLQKVPVEFAVNLVSVHGADSVTVTAVDLIDPVGIRLADVAFVPGGAVGDGNDFGDLHAATFPKMWAARKSLPNAILTPLTGADAPAKGTWSGDALWQAVVGVVPVGAVGGQSAGIRITYKVHGHTRVFTGHARVGVRRTFPECNAAVAIR